MPSAIPAMVFCAPAAPVRSCCNAHHSVDSEQEVQAGFTAAGQVMLPGSRTCQRLTSSLSLGTRSLGVRPRSSLCTCRLNWSTCGHRGNTSAASFALEL